MAWVALALLIIASGVPRLSHGSWGWRAGSSAAQDFGGIVLEWEWTDVAQSAWLAEGDPRWQGRLQPEMKGQNVLRFVPGVAVAWLGAWLRSAWPAAVVLTWLCWLASAAALFALCRALIPDSERGIRMGVVAAGLVALSPGFTAFNGYIDAHQFGYAGAALGLLGVEVAWRRSQAAPTPSPRTPSQWAVAAGGAMFLANGTLELGPPLLVLVWLQYAVASVAREPQAVIGSVRWCGIVTVTFLVLQGAWWLVANVAVLGHVASYNEGLQHLTSNAVEARADWDHLIVRVREAPQRAGAVFLTPVVLCALVGAVALPWRALRWCVLWSGLIAGAVLVTRDHPRTIYLAYPAVYVAAASGVEWLGRMLGRIAGRQGDAARWLPASVLLAVVGKLVLGDLWGDVTLPATWWVGQAPPPP